MKNFRSQYWFLCLIPAGFAVMAIAECRLNPAPGRANPLAIRESGFGMTLARLSQNSVDRVWHIGVEQVNPHGHGHGHHDHGHDHGHHGHGETCLECRGVAKGHGLRGVLNELRAAKSFRTNRHGLSERHRLTTAKKIENTLKKSYLLDPTHYGVYNDYYLFLTIHDLGSTEQSRARAGEISKRSIQATFFETENPEAFLTAASAVLNLFFEAQGQCKIAGRTLSREEVLRYSNLIDYCLAGYERLRGRRIAHGSWHLISPARRAEIMERARFARKTRAQFAAMLQRLPSGEPGSLVESGNNGTGIKQLER